MLTEVVTTLPFDSLMVVVWVGSGLVLSCLSIYQWYSAPPVHVPAHPAPHVADVVQDELLDVPVAGLLQDVEAGVGAIVDLPFVAPAIGPSLWLKILNILGPYCNPFYGQLIGSYLFVIFLLYLARWLTIKPNTLLLTWIVDACPFFMYFANIAFGGVWSQSMGAPVNLAGWLPGKYTWLPGINIYWFYWVSLLYPLLKYNNIIDILDFIWIQINKWL